MQPTSGAAAALAGRRTGYRQRNQIARLINRLKQFRRVATRYEKLVVSYLAMIAIAASLM